MKFEEFQRQWQSIDAKPKSHDELRRMMYSSPVGVLRRLTNKELLELAGSIAALIFFVGWMEALDHWPTIPFFIWYFVGMVDHYLRLRYRLFLPPQDTLQKTLSQAMILAKRMTWISRITHFLIWVPMGVFAAMKFHLGSLSPVWWVLILLPVLTAVAWWSSRTWAQKYAELKEILDDLNDDQPAPAV